MKRLMNLNKDISENDRKYPSVANMKLIGFSVIQVKTFTFLVEMMDKEELLYLKEEIRIDIKKTLLTPGGYRGADISKKPPQPILFLEFVNTLLDKLHNVFQESPLL